MCIVPPLPSSCLSSRFQLALISCSCYATLIVLHCTEHFKSRVPSLLHLTISLPFVLHLTISLLPPLCPLRNATSSHCMIASLCLCILAFFNWDFISLPLPRCFNHSSSLALSSIAKKLQPMSQPRLLRFMEDPSMLLL